MVPPEVLANRDGLSAGLRNRLLHVITGGFERNPVPKTADWQSPNWDDLDAIQAWALERREYLAAVLTAKSPLVGLVARRPSWRAVAV